MVVLGLFVEQPDTVGGIGIRVSQRFPDAHWARSLVYGCVPSLLRQDYVGLVTRGRTRALDRYGATSSGVAHFDKWVRESAVVPPVSRDALLGKLVFSARGDLPELIPALIGTVRAELEGCAQKYKQVHHRHQEARGLRHRSGEVAAAWEELVLSYEAKLWEKEVELRQELLDDLEGFRGTLPETLRVRDAADG
jgi:hypothetical protein